MGKQKNKIAKFKAKHADTRGVYAAKKKLKLVTKKQERNQKRTKAVKVYDEAKKHYKVIDKVARRGHTPLARKMLNK
jgi:RNA-splicing ligase RtcB